jgi:citrate synthase
MTFLTTAQAAQQLGIKPETLYAYVSRGVISARKGPDGRSSRFDSTEVAALGRRGRPREASRRRSLDLTVATAITRIDDHRLSWRGHRVDRLAGRVSFEQVADLLLTGQLGMEVSWPVGDPPGRRESRANVVRSSGDRDVIAGFQHALTAPTFAHRPAHAADAAQLGRRVITSLVRTLPTVGERPVPTLLIDGRRHRGSIAGQLWVRLTDQRATPDSISLVNLALLLLADHELAASTLAVRVAASTRASAGQCLIAGLAALSGPLHGGEGRRVRRFIAEAQATSPEAASAAALDRWGRVPGFGHVLYDRGDPRARLLSRAMRAASDVRFASALPWFDDLERAAVRVGGHVPNIDFSMAALTTLTGMNPDASDAVFAIARSAGWLAHAIEEWNEPPLRFRPRGVYIGPS